MESAIVKAIGFRHHPVVLIWTDEKPEGAMQFQEGKWGCVMWLAASAARGKSAVCDARTFGCFGGGVGLGFGNQYRQFPGGEEGFCHFLSSGNAKREGGEALAEGFRPFMTREAYEDFLHGEGYLKSSTHVEGFLRCLPMREIPARYVVFKALRDVRLPQETPRTVVFFADPDGLSALTILANYARDGNENVTLPYAAGCQTLGIYPYREAERDKPRAVVGLTDISARLYIRKQLGDNLLSFAVPWALFQEMEGNVAGSFLERRTWRQLRAMEADCNTKGQG